MAETTQFELVSPEKLLYSEETEMVVVPGAEGNFGVLPRHAPMISTLRPGVIDVYQKGSVAERIFVAGGFAEVTETRCTVLAEEALPLADVDVAKVDKDLADLRDDLKDAKADLERERIESRITVLEAMRAAASH
ncbi:F0F1 ATP synthase subunit epsilon [Nisaea sediminum]|uniref:F0F1 ATP synthase subunit epsilon n=1 Tax=Nisaea sediminum TaxID=2775867 RepID=UPI001866FDA5|nr:F0F1 ATP synthase subunit epsilon [Nisaea sediminum]